MLHIAPQLPYPGASINHIDQPVMMKSDEPLQIALAIVPPAPIGHDEKVHMISLGLADLQHITKKNSQLTSRSFKPLGLEHHLGMILTRNREIALGLPAFSPGKRFPLLARDSQFLQHPVHLILERTSAALAGHCPAARPLVTFYQ